MFKRCLSILLIVCTLSASFAKLFVFAGFEMNQKYIASTLCENRARPWMHCNGKCYLVKKVKAAEEKEKNAERQAQKNLIQEACGDAGLDICFSSQLLQVINSPYQIPATKNTPVKLFQPPRLA